MSAIPPARVRFTGRERLVLLVLLGAGFMLAVDFSILNVAFPDIGDGVGLGRAALPWITTAYMLPAAGFTLVFGRLGDLVGRRRLFLGGVALLIAASLLGGFSSGPGPLLTARVLQGFATAMATPAALSLLTSTFAEGAARDRALGLNGALLSGGFTVGAMVGGSLVSLLSWRAAFFINVPVAVVILAVAPALLVEGERSERVRLDLPGAVTVTGGLLAGTYSIIEKDWPAGAAAVILLVAFFGIERRADAPLVPIPVLRRPTVRWGNAGGFVAFTMEPAMIFLMTLYLQGTLHLSPLATGFVFGVPGLAAIGAGVVAGRFIGRHGARRVLTAGLAVQGLATLPLLLTGSGRWALAVLIPALFVGFFGHVTAIVAYTVTGTSGLPDGEQGLATGLTLMTQQVAITSGIPILSAVAATRGGETAGTHLALAVDVVVTLAGAALVWVGLRPRTPAAPDPAAGPAPVFTKTSAQPATLS
ncbi:MFS transporter [Catenulispora subtropica]|uniref:MFS transporter n=2 Tax=Catenulispora subtropica TaxID=450798 RepID=A0ABN2TFV5_9ACTN